MSAYFNLRQTSSGKAIVHLPPSIGLLKEIIPYSGKKALAEAIILIHPQPGAPTRLVTDASSTAAGAALEQLAHNSWQPLGFFPQQLKPPECRSSAFSRELLATYLAVKHFRHILEGTTFHIHTDHKPLYFAFQGNRTTYSDREVRHLALITE